MARKILIIVAGLLLFLLPSACTPGGVPGGSGVTVVIDADQGGTVTFRDAELSIPAHALSADAEVTLSLAQPAERYDEDPLDYVSDGYTVTAEALGGGNVDLTGPLSLGVGADVDTQQSYAGLLVAQVEPELPGNFVQLYPSESDSGARSDYRVFGTVQWAVAVPIIVNPIPTEGNILQVPWYHQSGLPWCAPPSRTPPPCATSI